MSQENSATARERHARTPQFGFFGEWMLQVVLFVGVIAALINGAASIGGTTIV